MPREDNVTNAGDVIADAIVQAKIRRALLSGPDCITSEATVAEMDAHGTMTVLRPGANQWVCIPGNENIIGQADMCADPMGMQWMLDIIAGKPKPTNTEPGTRWATSKYGSDPDEGVLIRLGVIGMVLAVG